MGRLLLIPLGLLALLIASMTWSGTATDGRADFTFINRGDIITLDTNQMSYIQDFRISYAIREGLFEYDPQTLAPIPGEAERVDISEDKRVYTFHLRPTAVWNNGDLVTAHDYLFAWRRMLESPGEYSYLFYYIKGADEYVQKYSKQEKCDFKDVGIEAVDSRTFRVTLSDPVTFFLDLIAFPPFYPLHERSMEPFKETNASTGRVVYNAKFTRPPGVVTNGPFNLKTWEFKRRLRLEKSPSYWDKANVKSNSIEMIVVEDLGTQFMRYEAGDVDWLSEVSSEFAPELKEKGRTDLRVFPGYGTGFLTVLVRPTFKNGQPNPLADVRIRQALSMSLDREQIIRNILRMGEKPAFTYTPPNIFRGFTPSGGYPYDPARAKQLLAEAGYPNGGVIPGVTYLFRSDSPQSKDLGQSYVRQWKEKLNLDIPLESVEAKIARQRLNDKDYAIAGASWIGDYPDPSTFTDKYRSTSENNDSGWINAEYDALLVQASKEGDVEKRLRILEKAEKILNDEVPIIPLYYVNNQYLFRDNVKGINLDPRNTPMLKAVHVVK